jgi:hypothetical protein
MVVTRECIDSNAVVTSNFNLPGSLVPSVAASEQNVGMVLEISTSNSVSVNRIPANADLGGWSGGPVFRVVDSGNIERLELAAIIYEYSETFEIALAHPLTDLAPDGTFLS